MQRSSRSSRRTEPAEAGPDTLAASALFDEAQRAYRGGKNVFNTLIRRYPRRAGEIIELAYDLQSGSYTELFERRDQHPVFRSYAQAIDDAIAATGARSVLDCGIGEATKWLYGKRRVDRLLGFDISFSRLTYARHNLRKYRRLKQIDVFRANLLRIPLRDSSVDLALTMHAIEPNAGRERAILDEVVRVASKYVCIMEPDYRSANRAMRARMTRLGYARNIFAEVSRCSDLHVLGTYKLENSANPLNETTVLIAKKVRHGHSRFGYTSPVSGKPLMPRSGYLAEKQGGFLFPVVGNIALLDPRDAILASSLAPNWP